MYSKHPSVFKAEKSKITESSGGVNIKVSSFYDMKRNTFNEHPHLSPISQRGSNKSIMSNKSNQIFYDKKATIRIKKENIVQLNIVHK